MLAVLLFASPTIYLLLPTYLGELMSNLLVLTEQVWSTYHLLSRMKAILLLELASICLRYPHLHKKVTLISTDMLGFKLELPQREDGPTKKTRPIYLDMQVIEAVPF